MLFHITATHDNLNCGGVQARKSGIDISTPEYLAEQSRWMEGNDKVKVVAAYTNQSSHRIFVVVEADNRNDGIQRLPVSSIEGQGPGQGDGLPRVRSKTVPSPKNLVVVGVGTVPPENDAQPVGCRVGRGGRDVDVQTHAEGIRPRG